ncbi:MAG: hypothetical protein IJZ74_01535 [Clostridia bacterium]|nr:hypothetical protein [Clostridia bacterium]
MVKPEIRLRVPGQREYALVLRLALGGVAILKDLDAGTLDDLRNAADEACDCLLHQGQSVAWLELNVCDEGDRLTVSLLAEYDGETEGTCPDADETEVSRAVLETLIPVVALNTAPCGRVERIDLTLPKAVAVGA